MMTARADRFKSQQNRPFVLPFPVVFSPSCSLFRHSREGGNPEPLTFRHLRRPARLDPRLRGDDGVTRVTRVTDAEERSSQHGVIPDLIRDPASDLRRRKAGRRI